MGRRRSQRALHPDVIANIALRSLASNCAKDLYLGTGERRRIVAEMAMEAPGRAHLIGPLIEQARRPPVRCRVIWPTEPPASVLLRLPLARPVLDHRHGCGASVVGSALRPVLTVACGR
jgi:hypothetical protein